MSRLTVEEPKCASISLENPKYSFVAVLVDGIAQVTDDERVRVMRRKLRGLEQSLCANHRLRELLLTRGSDPVFILIGELGLTHLSATLVQVLKRMYEGLNGSPGYNFDLREEAPFDAV